MAIKEFEIGHKFGPYEITYDEKSSDAYSKAIKNRDIINHSPFYLISTSFGILLEDINLEEGAVHLNQTVKWIKKINEKETIFAYPEIVSKTERRGNFFIKIKIQYRDGSKINLGESISTILISDLGEKN